MNLNQLFESKTSDATLIDMLPAFLPLALKILKLDHVPKIKLEKFIDDDEQPTFGKFVQDDNMIYIGLENRHPVDILRTLAHEMVHYKQNTEHQLASGSGRTGSPEENEAHQIAGVIMREFNKANPEFLKARPLEI
jgi:hypothetical protein